MQLYLRPLLERIQKGEIDSSCYKIFRDKEEDSIRVVLKPGLPKSNSPQSERQHEFQLAPRSRL